MSPLGQKPCGSRLTCPDRSAYPMSDEINRVGAAIEGPRLPYLR